MDRRGFLRAAGIGCGLVLVGGAGYLALSDDDPLDDHRDATVKVFARRYGSGQATELAAAVDAAYGELAADAPYIGGEDNVFSEWLSYGVYYLAVNRVLASHDEPLEVSGRVIYDIFEAQAEYPDWMLRAIGKLRYGRGYVKRLQAAVDGLGERRYGGNWVGTWVEGDGQEFDYGIDFTECGICKYYAAQGVPELAPYLCLSDEVGSRACGRGLVRYTTVAEGGSVCDFRFKWGRETYVAPLRDGWPPQFAGTMA